MELRLHSPTRRYFQRILIRQSRAAAACPIRVIQQRMETSRRHSARRRSGRCLSGLCQRARRRARRRRRAAAVVDAGTRPWHCYA
ncbi:hypothetical protein EVAR_46949_1 [Eumeta japonica]|uniref:Uncharacterized protein n=1 Tax=Eumeta variegata TaxID=151549 RepID=A0A4C1YI77_EUMVA|nr:hypothetical protein EVAR_46949_1 [Eumeta japonica]